MSRTPFVAADQIFVVAGQPPCASTTDRVLVSPHPLHACLHLCRHVDDCEGRRQDRGHLQLMAWPRRHVDAGCPLLCYLLDRLRGAQTAISGPKRRQPRGFRRGSPNRGGLRGGSHRRLGESSIALAAAALCISLGMSGCTATLLYVWAQCPEWALFFLLFFLFFPF